MAIEYVSELGDKLSNNNTASNLPKHIKVISAPNYQRTDNGVVTNPSLQTALDGKAASTHSHGNITSDGKVGTTANKPLITTTGGAVTTGSFGTSANTFCQGNDSRLSDARTPTSHASTATTYGVGSSTHYGHVKLYDNVTGSNTDGAPTQKAVKDAIAAVEGSKVKATAKTDNVNYKLLATASDSPTSGALTEAVYDTDITLNPSTNTINASLARTFSGSTVSETPIITVSGSTDGFKLTYSSETADLGITKLFTTDDANAKLSFGNIVSSTYKEALAISNGSANLTGTVNGYTIGNSVPSDAVFTDTTYTANNGVSLSGTTFSNSGVRSTTINGNYLRVNTGGTDADLTIPYATNAHRLRAAYAGFDNTTGYRLLAEIHPQIGTSANRIAKFDALFTYTTNTYSLAHIYVNIRTNHTSSSSETYNYYWGYIDEKPAASNIQLRAYTKTGSNSLFLFAYVSEAAWCGVQLSINQTSDYNGHYQVMDVVDLKRDDTRVASLDSSYTQVNATNSYHNVLAATSQVGSTSVPVYIKSNGTVDTCSTLAVDHGGTGITSNPSMLTDLGSTTAASVFATSPRPGITGTLGVGHGGTGKTTVTANNFLVGNGTSALVEKTPTEVRSLIGAGTSSLTIGTSSTTAAAGDHSHGNITTDGKLQSSDVSIASGDKIVVTDSSNGNKVARTSLSFDGTTTSQALTKKGTFETFAKITWISSIPSDPVAGMIYAI